VSENKFDTFAETVYLVKLAQDAKTFPRGSGDGDDVVLTFCDNSRIEGHESMWVDARLIKFQADRGKKYRKGDAVQIRGKLRFKLQDDGKMRGKIYDAIVQSFVPLSERTEGTGEQKVVSRPAFE
jgi:hypothetical protein